MRLTDEQAEIIRQAVAEAFGSGASVWLFGSRVDDYRRGGDIDLYIEADCTPHEAVEREGRLYARLQRRLGEQRIDVVTHCAGALRAPVHHEARRSGVRL